MDDIDFGHCNPPSLTTTDCSFSICPTINKESPSILSKRGTIEVLIEFQNHSWACNCDKSSWNCSQDFTNSRQVPMVAVAKVVLRQTTLYPPGIEIANYVCTIMTSILGQTCQLYVT